MNQGPLGHWLKISSVDHEILGIQWGEDYKWINKNLTTMLSNCGLLKRGLGHSVMSIFPPFCSTCTRSAHPLHILNKRRTAPLSMRTVYLAFLLPAAGHRHNAVAHTRQSWLPLGYPSNHPTMNLNGFKCTEFNQIEGGLWKSQFHGNCVETVIHVIIFGWRMHCPWINYPSWIKRHK